MSDWARQVTAVGFGPYGLAPEASSLYHLAKLSLCWGFVGKDISATCSTRCKRAALVF